jgi:extracellular factor (EF) 3-hydroxypalmitic acid methyl ester biosynthesis protein
MVMHANTLEAFQEAAFRFQSDTARLQLRLEKQPHDVPGARLEFERMVESLLDAARALETEAVHAPELVRRAQAAFRELNASVLSRSWLIDRSIKKPRGYPGDHALLDALYTGRTVHGGIGKFLDDRVLGCEAGRAVVARMRFAAEWLRRRLAWNPTAKIVDLACGPCRLERELLDAGAGERAHWIALDGDAEALAFAERVLGPHAERVQLRRENALRIARDRGASPLVAGADYLVSLGLFDYLPRHIAVALLGAIRRSLRPGSELLIGNFAEGNPSRAFMEWFGDWPLIYRSEKQFLDLFREAGFPQDGLSLERESDHGIVLLVTGRVPGSGRIKEQQQPGAVAAS